MAVAQRIAWLGFLGMAGIVLLLWFPYGALQDLPEWIYQGYLFNQIVDGHAGAAYFIKTYPVPYTAFQLLLSGFLLMWSPMLVSKWVVALYGGLALWVTRRLIVNRRLEPGLAWPVLVSIFVLNGPFWNGYMGYQFGLILFALYLSLELKARTDVRVLVTFSILAFFSHGVIFFAFGVAAAAVCFREGRLRVFIPAMMPCALLAAWYLLANTQSKVAGPPVVLPNLSSVVAYKLYTVMKLGPYHNFVVFGTDDAARLTPLIVKIGALANGAFIAAFLLRLWLVLRRDWTTQAARPELWFALVMVGIAVLLTPTAFGVGNPAERLFYPAFIALSIVAFGARQAAGEGRAAAGARLCLSVALTGGFVLSSASLIAAALVYHRESGMAHPPSTDAILSGRERTLFGHRMVQFDAWMHATDHAWRSSQVLLLPLVFDTALLGQPGGILVP